jgi:aminopeptidase N
MQTSYRWPALGLMLVIALLAAGCATGQPPGPQAPDPAAAPDGRLGDLASPRHYRLFMRIDPRADVFEAEVSIDVDLNRAADGIWLHGRGLAVDRAGVTRGGETRPAAYTEVLPTGVSYLDFGRRLEPGPLRLDVAYSGRFDRNLSGLFKVEEQGEAYVLAKSESIQARGFLVGFDEPGFKASWDVVLEIPEGYVAIANGAEIRRTRTRPGFERVEFARVRPTSTFLLSLAVGPFEVVEYAPVPPNEFRPTPIPLRGVARPGKTGELGAILELTAPMVETFERALRQPYPYPKLDIVAAPDWPSGATELAAAPTYREERILLGPNPSPGAVLAMESIHAHEIAHMWFGNLVTPPWWNDLWLKEGFATWGEPATLAEIDPEGGHALTATLDVLRAMDLDSLASARAIREPVTDNATIRSAYDSITYAKSLAVLTMVDHWLGADRFRPALGRYIVAYADQAPDAGDFYRLIGEATGEPRLTETFRGFVERNGLPLLDVRLECGETPAVVLRQRRYAPPGSAIDPARTWTLPVCLRHEGGTACALLEEAESRMPLGTASCPSWFVANAGGTGYFRVELAGDDWQALLRHWPALTPAERILSFDSLAAQSLADPALQPTADEMAARMALDPHWQVAIQPFDYWRERLRFADPAARERLRGELLTLLRTERLRPVSSETAADDLLYQYRLQAFLAVELDDAVLEAALARSAARFMDGDASALASDQYFTALVSFLRTSPDAYDRVIAARRRLDDPRFDDASARALGRAAGGRVEATLEYLFSDAVGPREAYVGLLTAAQEDALQPETWRWLTTHSERIEDKIPAQWVGRLPSVGRRFCDAALGAEWDRWMRDWVAEQPSARRAYEETAERIEICLARKQLSGG